MQVSEPVLIAMHDEARAHLLPAMANRHGLITGATGTGKTVTLQVLAEAFSAMGTPVFLADIKGDLTGLGQAGQPGEKMLARLSALGLPTPEWAQFPVSLWDVFAQAGHPLRATVQDLGPVLLARMLSLNDTQTGVLAVVFKVAQDDGLPLIDLADLRAMLAHVAERASALQPRYGNVSSASVGAIQRTLLMLESQGADAFFGEPALDIADLMRIEPDGRGRIAILAADQLMRAPRLYAVFLLWLLTALYDRLPESGDLARPKLVFFFDEAHLLFNDAPAALLEKVEQIVRLIRSKGVGVWFVTQNPADIPDTVLGQLGNRVQHALRAYTPRDEQAVKVAARTMRPNPGLDIQAAMTELAVGEALVSMLDEKGRPSPTQRLWIRAPASRIGPADEVHRQAIVASSAYLAKYDKRINRESAYERLNADAPPASTQARGESAEKPQSGPAQGRQRTSVSRPSGSAPGSQAPSSGTDRRAPASVPDKRPPAKDARGQRTWTDGLSDAVFGSVGPRGGRRDGLLQMAVKTTVRTGVRALVRTVTAMFKRKR